MDWMLFRELHTALKAGGRPGPEDSRERLEAAGFAEIDVSLEPAPTTLPDRTTFADFMSCVCIRHHMDTLPPGERAPFVDALADAASGDDPPYTLDCWQLNTSARRREADA